MKLIYHAGTQTYFDASDDVYIINTEDLTTTELQALEDGDDSILDDVIDTPRATIIWCFFGCAS